MLKKYNIKAVGGGVDEYVSPAATHASLLEDKLLQKIEEIDYLSPLDEAVASASNLRASQYTHVPAGLGDTDPQPIFQRVVLTRDQLLRKLEQLKEVEQADRDTEANMLRNLVTQIINDS